MSILTPRGHRVNDVTQFNSEARKVFSGKIFQTRKVVSGRYRYCAFQLFGTFKGVGKVKQI